MIKQLFKREHPSTAFVLLDTKKCEACWKCLSVCKSKVIGRINRPWHKHIRFVKGSACIGCLMCVRICKASAISKLGKG